MSGRHSRRHLLGGSAAMLLLAAPAAGDVKAAELDGPLIALCDQYCRDTEAYWRRWDAQTDEERFADKPPGWPR